MFNCCQLLLPLLTQVEEVVRREGREQRANRMLCQLGFINSHQPAYVWKEQHLIRGSADNTIGLSDHGTKQTLRIRLLRLRRQKVLVPSQQGVGQEGCRHTASVKCRIYFTTEEGVCRIPTASACFRPIRPAQTTAWDKSSGNLCTFRCSARITSMIMR